MELIFNNLDKLILTIQNQQVLLDSDVAAIYGVETKRINEAVKNNPDKFPEGYILLLNTKELGFLRSKISTAKFAKTRTLPKVFTEKGLYMLATILKSEQATQATISIIETFAKVRELSKSIHLLPKAKTEAEQKSLMQRGGEIIAEILDGGLTTSGSETSFELNFAVLKFKHTVKKEK